MRFEYKYVRLLNDIAGQKAVEDMLNRLGAEGWDLVGTGVLPGGWGIMKRVVPVAGALKVAA